MQLNADFSKFESGAVASDILVVVRGLVSEHQRHRQLKKECTRDVNEDQTAAAVTGTIAGSDIKLSAVRKDEGCVISAGNAAEIWDGTRSALVERVSVGIEKRNKGRQNKSCWV